MFSKSSNNLPKRYEFSLTAEQFLADIEVISKSEEQRKILYQCIDSKMPEPDPALIKLEKFLRDTEGLDELESYIDDKLKQMIKRRDELIELRDEMLKSSDK